MPTTASDATPRILLLTGKGGVGTSTIAAGTAAVAAAAGHRTLVLSTAAGHCLGDVFGLAAGAEPTRVADRLFVQQVDTRLRLERSWAEVRAHLLSVLDGARVDRVAADELTVLPGAEEVLALLELRAQVLSEAWDVVVVDCAPSAETLRLLALPEALGWYLRRILPARATVVRALRPALRRAAGVPAPSGGVVAAAERLHHELGEVHALLSGPRAGVRIVMTPERVVLAEARRSWTSLSLFGYRVDGVVANRVFPAEDADDWRASWVMAQDRVLAEAEESFAGLPVWRSAYRPVEPVGVEALLDLATRLYDGSDPLALPTGAGPVRVTRTTGGATLHLALPLVTRADVDLARHGDELVVTVGSYRRLLALPAGLARRRVVGAGVEGGELRVRFRDEAAAAVVRDAVRVHADDQTSEQATGTDGSRAPHRRSRGRATGEAQ